MLWNRSPTVCACITYKFYWPLRLILLFHIHDMHSACSFICQWAIISINIFSRHSKQTECPSILIQKQVLYSKSTPVHLRGSKLTWQNKWTFHNYYNITLCSIWTHINNYIQNHVWALVKNVLDDNSSFFFFIKSYALHCIKIISGRQL